MNFKELRTPRVFIPNKSFHDFSTAQEYGELVYLTEGRIPNRYQINEITRMCAEKMNDARPSDYLLISGPTSVNVVAASILSYRFGRVNYLIYDSISGVYSSRTVLLANQWERESLDG